MRILKRGLFVDLVRLDEKKDNFDVHYCYAAQIRNKDGSKVIINCVNFTGASILVDTLNNVLISPRPKEPNAPNVCVLHKGE